MADFICEERPTSRQSHVMPLNGFVAELRPSSGMPSPFLVGIATEETALKPHISLQEDRDSNQFLLKNLSNKSNKEYTAILTKSVVTLIQTVLAYQEVASIEGSLQIAFHGEELPIQIKLNEIYSSEMRCHHFNVEKDIGTELRHERSSSTESIWEADHCQFNQFSPISGHRDTISSVGSSPSRNEQMLLDVPYEGSNSTVEVITGEKRAICLNTRNDVSPPHVQKEYVKVEEMSHDSETESGYATNDIDYVSDGHHSDYNSKRNMPNIIHVNNASTGDKEKDVVGDIDQRLEVRHSDEEIPTLHVLTTIGSNIMSSSSDESENNLLSTSSEDTDSDLSGDCKIMADSESIYKEQDDGLVEFSPLIHQFKCKLCSCIFVDANSLSNHARCEHQVYTCHLCSRVFTAKNNLKRHIRIHTGLRPYKCPQCPMTFGRRDDLKGHLLRHDYSKPFRCSICKKGYTDRACVKNHMVKEHGSRQMHVCPQCGESFDREDEFSKHKKTHPELSQFACGNCPFIGSNNLMACKHSLIHTHKLFSCKPCNAYFADPLGYTDHIRKHKKNEAFTSYVCCFCDIKLPTYEQFVRHEYSHAHFKTNVCFVCDKQFRSKGLLKQHLAEHSRQDKGFSNVISSGEHTLEMESADYNDILESPMNNQESIDHHVEEEHQLDDVIVEAESISTQDEVLDLTVSKPVINTNSNRCVISAQSFNDGQENISSIIGVPRNGCASELFSCPRGEECTMRHIGEMAPTYVSLNSEHQNTACDINVLEQQQELQRKSIETAANYQQRPLEYLENTISTKASSSPIAPCQSNLKASHKNMKRKHKYTPYPGPSSKAAQLTAKFFAARGCHPFTDNSAMKNISNTGFHHRLTDQNKLVLENDSTRRPSIHIMTRPALETNEDQTARIVYGLTGKQYGDESPMSLSSSFLVSEPSHIFTPVKSEPMDTSNILVPFESSHSDNIPESVPSPISTTSPNPGAGEKCDICCQTFQCFSQLESHSVVMHKRFMCQFCLKGFTSRPNRDRHVRYHTGERPYKCDLCPTAFHRGDDLKYHRTSKHTEARPFLCPRCSASFTWKGDLDRHIRHSKCKT